MSKKYLNENNIPKLTIIAPIITLVLFTVLVVSYFVEQTNSRFESEISKLENSYVEHQKELVKREVLRTVNYVNYRIKNVCDNDPKIIKEETLDFISTIRYGIKGYIFIIDYNGKVVYNPFMKKDLNVVSSTDQNGKAFVQELIKQGKERNGGFVEYESRSISSGSRISKISYVNHVKDWKWIVGGGVYIDEISEVIKQKREEKQKHQEEDIQKILTVSFVLLIIIAIFSLVITRSINSIFKKYKLRVESKKRKLEEFNQELESLVNQKTSELQELNKDLEKRVEDELRKNREKDEILIMQSRLASMGEMISNIAHQWRQPLNKISLILNNMRIDKALNSNIDEEKYFKSIEETLSYMSHTIDDFRHFFTSAEEARPFDIKTAIEQSLSIVDVSLQDKNIRLDLSLEKNDYVLGIDTEFSQVLINILNNAKDVLLSNNIKEPYIKIEQSIVDNESIVKICDNGTGIDEEIIHKIFDPYFTTKHKNQGTGIGLYMSKNIIEKKMNGTLNVENDEHGACFIIKIPSTEPLDPSFD
jgi:signal transduction histidine kinase